MSDDLGDIFGGDDDDEDGGDSSLFDEPDDDTGADTAWRTDTDSSWDTSGADTGTDDGFDTTYGGDDTVVDTDLGGDTATDDPMVTDGGFFSRIETTIQDLLGGPDPAADTDSDHDREREQRIRENALYIEDMVRDADGYLLHGRAPGTDRVEDALAALTYGLHTGDVAADDLYDVALEDVLTAAALDSDGRAADDYRAEVDTLMDRATGDRIDLRQQLLYFLGERYAETVSELAEDSSSLQNIYLDADHGGRDDVGIDDAVEKAGDELRPRDAFAEHAARIVAALDGVDAPRKPDDYAVIAAAVGDAPWDYFGLDPAVEQELRSQTDEEGEPRYPRPTDIDTEGEDLRDVRRAFQRHYGDAATDEAGKFLDALEQYQDGDQWDDGDYWGFLDFSDDMADAVTGTTIREPRDLSVLDYRTGRDVLEERLADYGVDEAFVDRTLRRAQALASLTDYDI